MKQHVYKQLERLWRTMLHGQPANAFRVAQRIASIVSPEHARHLLDSAPSRLLRQQTGEEWVGMIYAARQIEFFTRAGAILWDVNRYRPAVLFFHWAAFRGSDEGSWFEANALLWLGEAKQGLGLLRDIANRQNEYSVAAAGLMAFDRVQSGATNSTDKRALRSALSAIRSGRGVAGDLTIDEYESALHAAASNAAGTRGVPESAE